MDATFVLVPKAALQEVVVQLYENELGKPLRVAVPAFS
jgi:hypothetical protein